MKTRLALRAAALLSLELIVPGFYEKIDAAFAAPSATGADRISFTMTEHGGDVILIPDVAFRHAADLVPLAPIRRAARA